jgi:hypothetical protein
MQIKATDVALTSFVCITAAINNQKYLISFVFSRNDLSGHNTVSTDDCQASSCCKYIATEYRSLYTRNVT